MEHCLSSPTPASLGSRLLSLPECLLPHRAPRLGFVLILEAFLQQVTTHLLLPALEAKLGQQGGRTVVAVAPGV